MANEIQGQVAPSASVTIDRPSVAELPNNFREAYAALGTGRLVTTGAATLSGPAVDDSTMEKKIYGGKFKIWATPIMEARPDATNVDYETKKAIVAPGSIEIYVTEAQLASIQKQLNEGFTSGMVIQARQGDVPAYDLPADAAVRGICSACHTIEAELPFVLLIERPESSLDYSDARQRRQGAGLVEAGRGHYLNGTQVQQAAQGFYGAGAKAALAGLLSS